jgi:hypothetical protein
MWFQAPGKSPVQIDMQSLFVLKMNMIAMFVDAIFYANIITSKNKAKKVNLFFYFDKTFIFALCCYKKYCVID